MPTERLDQLTAATARFARLVDEIDPAAPVPSCPGWTVTDLVDHLGGVHQWARHAVVAGTPDGKPEPADATRLSSWYAEQAAALVESLRSAGPEGPAWVFGDGPATAGWWVRRQLHETEVHTFDLLAAGLRTAEWPPEPEVAWDGVDEVATMLYPRQVRLGRVEPLPTAVRLTASDLDDATLVLGDGAAEVELRATAADVLLTLWRRRPVDDLTLAALLERAVTP